MTPYRASGESARRALAARTLPRDGGRRQRALESLRAFKFVINSLCVAAMIFTPLIGLHTQSAHAALATSLGFFVVIGLLEVLESRTKRALRQA